MCGIAGTYGWADAGELRSMLDAISHRGPDEEGVHVDRDAGLAMGARRLAIVDLAGGSQPKWNEDGTVGVVFNGEIYNHAELRETLRERGHRFESRCDTEVLVHLWEEYGADLASHLRGMFAFAVWDSEAGTVCLGRDRVGIKPLYYAWTDRGVAWGSEIRPLLVAGADRTVDRRAVHAHLSLDYTPTPRTLFRSVGKVRPGHTVTLGADGLEERQYWRLFDVDAGSATCSLSSAADRVESLLRRSVERRLMADVPVGAFLSGGLDSSAVVGIAAELKDDPIRTYSLSFKQAALDESAEARAVADEFGTDHHEVHVDLSSMDYFGEMVRHLGEPTGHVQTLPLFALSRRASEDLKVVLAGDGADELFSGYPYYQNVPRRKRLVDVLPGAAHDVAGAVASVTPVGGTHLDYVSRLKTPSAAVLNNATGRLSGRHRAESLLDGGDTAATDGLRNAVEGVCSQVSAPALEHHISAFEISHKLPDSVLYKTDHTTMAASLEARVPFLSTDLVEYAYALPAAHKVTPDDVKRVLKAAVADVVPESVRRREKQAMGMPVHDLFRAEHPAIERWFARPELARTPHVDADRALGLRDAHRRGDARAGWSLWTILTYVAWYHTFVDPDTAVV